MTSIVAEVRSTDTWTPLAGLLTAPLDWTWEVTPEHLVVQ
jgi:hypothetical protein